MKNLKGDAGVALAWEQIAMIVFALIAAAVLFYILFVGDKSYATSWNFDSVFSGLSKG